jgi:hypothetical protein
VEKRTSIAVISLRVQRLNRIRSTKGEQPVAASTKQPQAGSDDKDTKDKADDDYDNDDNVEDKAV